MAADENIQLVRELGQVKAELAGVKAEVVALRERIDDIVITQLKDHGKRLSALESSEQRRVGAIAIVSFICASAGAILIKVLHI